MKLDRVILEGKWSGSTTKNFISHDGNTDFSVPMGTEGGPTQKKLTNLKQLLNFNKLLVLPIARADM